MSEQPALSAAALSAAEVVAVNARLDSQLLDELGRADLARPGGAEHWVAAEVAAHLAEFPLFFAAEIDRWLADRSVTVGRTHDDERRLAAVAAAGGLDHAAAQAAVASSFAVLAAALGRLGDGDIRAATHNVKYGEEPLSAFLDRYVLGHKSGHLEQLRAMQPQQADRPGEVGRDTMP